MAAIWMGEGFKYFIFSMACKENMIPIKEQGLDLEVERLLLLRCG